jgi:hypothetical protein
MRFEAEHIQAGGCHNPSKPPRPNLTSKQKTKIEMNRRF